MLMRPLLCCLIWIVPWAAQAAGYFVVTTDGVNIRQGPGQQWQVVAIADQGQLVLENERKGQWSQISFLSVQEKAVQGWIFNTFLQPQTIPPRTVTQLFDVTAQADRLVCSEDADSSITNLCYLDIHFTLIAKGAAQRKALVTCWADFIVPAPEDVIPIQTADIQSVHLLAGRAEGMIRLNIGLDKPISDKQQNLAYYNCSAE